ncbi:MULTISPECIES: helix-turn-helix domain-containing protein [Streptomyces]|uniref:Transcriptional regulator with XRE-family HTH domain n=1 Tax=Streptomyces stelliscabiei TaxID=146820 RepID=A0A8I0TTR0_9ACTN|nr:MULTISPECIES: helix-turn-helix domain-containing protein [Streptomyces]MBE1599962.1 transcriptional regulator with XRE-family HTH domain [Streptomyces stelliscabiei]MDX2515872.1 helix-turn-helix domain-containing protein [Streptomyces stelliscabiei]MDX2549451.1 helix-turn-helix domain-containing protein [Streptomyces stelliscabiei]MDX2611473.1 helix-turn-helix domain-containing protein [Streptomyces stelliscabiei]MDX2634431.1 helix-turn-helix domain-containing protein [Streptomyces stellisc
MVESSGSAEVPSGASGGRQLSLADKLNHLFETVKNPATGKKFTNAEVSRAIREAGEADGLTVSESAISQLRSGAKPNPTVNTVEALARHFNVTPQYFFPDFDAEESEKIRASMELIAAVGDTKVRGLALRANGLSADSLKMITTVIEQARRLEGLDKPDNPSVT